MLWSSLPPLWVRSIPLAPLPHLILQTAWTLLVCYPRRVAVWQCGLLQVDDSRNEQRWSFLCRSSCQIVNVVFIYQLVACLTPLGYKRCLELWNVGVAYNECLPCYAWKLSAFVPIGTTVQLVSYTRVPGRRAAYSLIHCEHAVRKQTFVSTARSFQLVYYYSDW